RGRYFPGLRPPGLGPRSFSLNHVLLQGGLSTPEFVAPHSFAPNRQLPPQSLRSTAEGPWALRRRGTVLSAPRRFAAAPRRAPQVSFCVRVHALRAEGLSRMAPNALGVMAPTPASLPFCRCTVAGRTESTVTISYGENPEWGDAWVFPVKERDTRGEVLVEVFDAVERGEGAPGSSCVLLGSARRP
ncbi:unnamed protein product, partial [Prorocentrum cordatum]